MVRCLQDVAAQPCPCVRQRFLPAFPHVPRQQETDRTVVQPHHDGVIPACQREGAGVEDGEQKPVVQGHLQAPLPPPDLLYALRDHPPPVAAEGARAVLVTGDQVADRVPFQHRDQARQDVFCGTGEDDQVQVVVPEGHPAAQGRKEVRRPRRPTDQYLPPRRGADEDGVPALHVQEDDVQLAVGQGEAGNPRQQEKERGGAQQETVAQAPRQTPPEGAQASPYLGVRDGGECANSAVEGPRPRRRHPAHVHPGVGDTCRPLDDLYGVRQEEPGHPAQDLPQGKPEQPTQGRQSAPDHHRWLRRKDQEVGQEGDEGEAAEIVEGQWEGGDLRSQSDQKGVGEEAHGLPGPLLGGHAGQEAEGPALEPVYVEHQPQGGGETQLESDVPQSQGVPEGHRDGGSGQGGGDVGGAAQVPSEQVEDTHDGGPHHRRRRPHQKSIEGDARDGRPDGPSGAEPAAEDLVEEATDDGDVEPTDGDDVAGARGGEGIADVLRDAAFHPQEDAGQEGGGWLVEDAADHRLGALPEGEEDGLQRVHRPLPHPDGLGPPDEGEDSLLGQVLAVGEIGEFGRGLQEAGDLQPVAVGEGGVAGEVDQGGPLNGDPLAVGEGEGFGPQAHAGMGIPFIRRGGDGPLYEDGAHVVVVGQGVGGKAGEGDEEPSRPQHGHQEKGAEGADGGLIPPANPDDDGRQSEEEQGLPGRMEGLAQSDTRQPCDGPVDQRHAAPPMVSGIQPVLYAEG